MMQLSGRHSEILNAYQLSSGYRYSFQNQENDKEIKGSGNSINYSYRMHDPRVGRFFAVDPIGVYFPHNSPYAFSENRLLDALELEGLEIVEINPNQSSGDAVIYQGAQEVIKDKGAIHVVMHGSQNSLTKADGSTISTGAQFNNLLIKWGYKDIAANGENSVIVLHSCRTGRPIIKSNGDIDPPIAQKISKSTGGIVIAPDERDFFSSDGEVGPFIAKFTEPLNGNYSPSNLPQTARGKSTGWEGNWMVYKSGVLVAVMDQDWNPTGNITGNDLIHMKKLTYTVTSNDLHLWEGPAVNSTVKLDVGATLIPTGNAEKGWMEVYTESGSTGWVAVEDGGVSTVKANY